MNANFPSARQILVFIVGAITASGQLLAADNDKDLNESHIEKSEAHYTAMRVYFDNEQKQLVRRYFTEEKRRLRCPPGLAKKHNGCNPPGQLQRWQLGQTLQQEVNYSVLPADLTAIFGQPQAGYHYGMVDSDILLLIDGTEMVVDAITNFGQ